MHLPWKKSKIGRVSRLVADLRSSKHGGSLVVETGFPTSLIDLIVKNRDRLKKSSSSTTTTTTTTKKNKKRKNQQQSDSLEISENSSPPPPSSSQLLASSNSLDSTTLTVVSSSPNHPHLRCKNGEGEKKIPNLIPPNQKVEEEQEQEQEQEQVVEEVISSISAPNRTFMLIMKFFFLLILAIGTKKLAIAITVLAFFLLFLEFSCSSLFFCFLKQCPNAKKRFNSVVESVVSSVHPQKDEPTEEAEEEQGKTTTIPKSSCRGGMFESEEDNTVSENFISMAKEEQGSTCNEEIQMIEPGFDSLHCGCRWGFAEKLSKRMKNEDLIHENANIRNNSWGNGSAKFKSKLLKKFVPKKFRHSKKKRNDNNEDEEEERNLEGGDSTSDLSNSQEDDDEKSNRGEQQKQQDQDNQEEEDKYDDDEHQSSGYVSQIKMQTDNGNNAGRR